MHGEMRNVYKAGRRKAKRPLGRLSVDKRIIIKRLLNKYGAAVAQAV
jgi:hypothetical protein